MNKETLWLFQGSEAVGPSSDQKSQWWLPTCDSFKSEIPRRWSPVQSVPLHTSPRLQPHSENFPGCQHNLSSTACWEDLLERWFSDASLHQNPQEGFTDCWLPSPEFLMLEVWGGPRLCISNIFMGDTDALGTTVANHFLFSRGSLIKQEKIKSLCWVIVDVSYLKSYPVCYERHWF